MAIIVEEEKNSVNIIRIAAWGTIAIVICVAAYYIFFAAPDLVVISPPAGFEDIEPVSQFKLQPEDVLNSPDYQALKPPSFPLPTPTGPAAVGRTNPFISP